MKLYQALEVSTFIRYKVYQPLHPSTTTSHNNAVLPNPPNLITMSASESQAPDTSHPSSDCPPQPLNNTPESQQRSPPAAAPTNKRKKKRFWERWGLTLPQGGALPWLSNDFYWITNKLGYKGYCMKVLARCPTIDRKNMEMAVSKVSLCFTHLTLQSMLISTSGPSFAFSRRVRCVGSPSRPKKISRSCPRSSAEPYIRSRGTRGST